jgi:hypothetical protein
MGFGALASTVAVVGAVCAPEVTLSDAVTELVAGGPALLGGQIPDGPCQHHAQHQQESSIELVELNSHSSH